MLDKIINLIKEKKKIIIFGDLVLDKYVEISSSRLSSETIIPVMIPDKKYSFLGCAGNVAKIINEFNCDIFLFTVIGKNQKTIENICKKENINIDFSVYDNNFNQNKKRYIHNNQQYFRIDNCDNFNYQQYKEDIESNLELCIKNNKIDLLIIPDYQLGFCSDLTNVIKIAKKNNIKIIIDPHGNDLMKYEGCDIFKPNKSEIQQLSGIKITNNKDLIKCAEKIVELINPEIIITTLGSEGLFIYKQNGDTTIIPTKKVNFVDVCGAGDTINSIISLGILNDIDIYDICKIANLYASLFIKKIGTSKIYFYEILSVIKKPVNLNLDDLIIFTHYLKKYDNIKIGITTGCFDIFHSGHLESLKFAKNNCNILILLLNSDVSIKKLKGDNRPINNLEHRKNLLMQLDFIDFITIFDEKDANPIIDKLNFNILFKGGDYNIDKLNKQFPNIEIKISNYESDISTTIIEKKIRDLKN